MNTDSYFAIGKASLICQDYAFHDNGKLPFGLVADGSSTSPHTDFGARLLALAGVERLTMWGDCLKSQWVIHRAQEGVDETFLPHRCLDSTLGAVFRTLEGTVRAIMTGDGIIIARRRGSEVVEHWNIEFNEGAPGYLSYQVNAKRLSQYLSQGLGQRTVTHFISGGLEDAKRSSVADDFDFVVEFDPKVYDLVMIASSGLNSFQRAGCWVPLQAVVPHLTPIQDFQGKYLVQRMRQFLTEWCPANGWHHEDDVSVAALHIP
jgi:hypothetical protein